MATPNAYGLNLRISASNLGLVCFRPIDPVSRVEKQSAKPAMALVGIVAFVPIQRAA